MKGGREGLRWTFLLALLGLTCVLLPEVSTAEEVLVITTTDSPSSNIKTNPLTANIPPSKYPDLEAELSLVLQTIRQNELKRAESLLLLLKSQEEREKTSRMIKEIIADYANPTPKRVKPEIYSFRIQSDIKYRYSRTYVTSRVANKDLEKSQEVTFRIVLPETAFISKFVMEIDGKTYEAFVKSKDEAKKVYKEAQSQGQSAGLVELSERNSNVFKVNVNIKSQAKVTFNLTYEELLSRKLGHYEQLINISPEQVSSIKDFEIEVNIKESQNITELRVPDNRNDVEAQQGTEGNIDGAVIERIGGSKAQIRWKPNVKDHKKQSKEKMPGQFVVQYDINREFNSGEVLVMEGYFVHFFAPENLKPLRQHVVLILDVSGSMQGSKMEQLKVSQKQILDDLSADDFFNIITFSSDVHLWSPNRTLNSYRNSRRHGWNHFHGEITPTSELKKQPIPATKDNIEKAKAFIDSLEAHGGTNIHDSIITALNLTSSIKDARDAILETSQNPLRSGKTILPKNVESLIIFLTDGEASTGITNLNDILERIKSANRNLKIPLFSLAFGKGASFPFLKKLSLQNFGFGRKIYEASDAALQLKGFYNEIASPLLSNVVFNYTSPAEYNLTDITITRFPTLFNGTEIAIAGKITPVNPEIEEFPTEEPIEQSSVEGTPEGVEGDAPVNNNNYYSYLVLAEKKYLDVSIIGLGREGLIDFNAPTIFSQKTQRRIPSLPPRPTPTPPPGQDAQSLERLWAYLTIKQLIEKDFAENDDSSNVGILTKETPKKQALQLALKYGFVTPLTSLVVIKPESTQVTDATPSDVKPDFTDTGSAPRSRSSIRTGSSSSSRIPGMSTSHKIERHQSPIFPNIRESVSLSSYGEQLRLAMERERSQRYHQHMLERQSSSSGREQIRNQMLSSILDRVASRPTFIQRLDKVVPPGSSQSVSQSLQTPALSHGSFSNTTRPTLTISDLEWYDNGMQGLRINNTLYQLVLDNTVEDFDSYNCTIIKAGESGKCVHLKDCVQPAFVKSESLFRHSYFCPIQPRSEVGTNYVGTCCP